MSTGSVPAQQSRSRSSPSHKHGTPDNNPRPKKRVRLEEDMFVKNRTRFPQEDTALEVDVMILEYLIYSATQACLNKRQQSEVETPQSLESILVLVDSFVSIFKARHASYRPDAELRFRMLLLKFTTLFTQRATRGCTSPALPALQELRSKNGLRARDWIGEERRLPSMIFETQEFETELPVDRVTLDRTRVSVLRGLGCDPANGAVLDSYYGTIACVALLDILPLFMRISAARNALNSSNLTSHWMELACNFMLHACLEQYLVCGTHGTDAIDEAYSWGYRDMSTGPKNPNERYDAENDEINQLFEAEEFETELEGWNDARTEGIRKLCISGVGHRDVSLPDHLEALLRENPIAEFEASMRKFLSALHNSTAEPVLLQLEKGKLEGMDEKQTAEFLRDCGVAGAKIVPCSPSVEVDAPLRRQGA